MKCETQLIYLGPVLPTQFKVRLKINCDYVNRPKSGDWFKLRLPFKLLYKTEITSVGKTQLVVIWQGVYWNWKMKIHAIFMPKIPLSAHTHKNQQPTNLRGGGQTFFSRYRADHCARNQGVYQNWKTKIVDFSWPFPDFLFDPEKYLKCTIKHSRWLKVRLLTLLPCCDTLNHTIRMHALVKTWRDGRFTNLQVTLRVVVVDWCGCMGSVAVFCKLQHTSHYAALVSRLKNWLSDFKGH